MAVNPTGLGVTVDNCRVGVDAGVSEETVVGGSVGVAIGVSVAVSSTLCVVTVLVGDGNGLVKVDDVLVTPGVIVGCCGPCVGGVARSGVGVGVCVPVGEGVGVDVKVGNTLRVGVAVGGRGVLVGLGVLVGRGV